MRGLPQATAQKLLAELEPEMRSRVRREIAELVDVDPMEQRRALESFTGSMRRGAARRTDADLSRSDAADEIRISDAAQSAASAPHFRNHGDNSRNGSPNRTSVVSNGSGDERSSLAFLDRINDDDLLSLLRDEHPQTKAVVLAQIRPARAAALLPRLGGRQRQDILTRIGRLPNLPEEMLAEIANSFRARVDRLLQERSSDPLRHVPPTAAAVSPRLQAILAEMPTTQTGRSQPAGLASKAPRVRDYPSGDHDDSLGEQEERAENTAERLRRITRDETAEPFAAPKSSASDLHEMSTDEIHQELVRMAPRELCEALGRVETRTAILALCGLPNKVADAAIACLPRPQANQVRSQLMAVGSLEIRDIDRAKEQIARASRVGGRLQPATLASASPSAAPRVAVAM